MGQPDALWLRPEELYTKWWPDYGQQLSFTNVVGDRTVGTLVYYVAKGLLVLGGITRERTGQKCG